VSYMLLWQPSECVYLINDYVMLFSKNKYDKYDDDDLCTASKFMYSNTSTSVREELINVPLNEVVTSCG